VPYEIFQPSPNLIIGFPARGDMQDGGRILQLKDEDRFVFQADFKANDEIGGMI
jgi:hypothetical protein